VTPVTVSVTFRQPAEPGAAIKLAGVEKIRRQAPCLGFEFSEAQHARLQGEREKVFA